MLGRLTIDALPLYSAIAMGGALIIVFGTLGAMAVITWLKAWGYLFREWFTSVDHKRLGIMYIALAIIMLLRGFVDAIMMRTQQAIALNSDGYLAPDHFDQIFSSHGTIMIFFMAMPFLTGLMNLIVPLQIGSRDVAFPYMNSMSLWLTAAGAALVMVSLMIGKFSTAGWTAYPPYSGIAYSPYVGVDYWIWAVLISGIGSTMTGINFVVTILKRRAPGMTLMRMPLFTWTALCTAILMTFAFPAITVVATMLELDRVAGMHFFTSGDGGNMMMFANLLWIWGHPEVYILILPAFGVYSSVVTTFSSKRLFGYTSLVWATCAIAILSFTVWLHHFFTMGSDANVNAAFGIATMIIAVPTGVKVFDWLFTMYRGRIRFTVPMMYLIAFIVTFVIGGMTGVLLALPPADYLMHNTTFLVAHFHNMLIPGALFGYFAALNMWFPKAFGFKLDHKWGVRSFWCWVVGFYLAFMPLYLLGFMGMPRRMEHYDTPAWQPWLIVAFVGAVLILFGLAFLIVQIAVSFRNRAALRDWTGDPWHGRTLEWATSSPPAPYNFAVLPQVEALAAFHDMKERGVAYQRPARYVDILMPKNSIGGMVLGGLAFVLGFAAVWHMWWLVAVCFVAAVVSVIIRASSDDTEYVMTAAEVEAIEDQRYADLAKAPPAELEGVPTGIPGAPIPAGEGIVSETVVPAPAAEEASAAEQQAEEKAFGFWIYLMSDAIIFSLLFATYVVLSSGTAGGPTGAELFSLPHTFGETMLLLFSSVTFGMATVAMFDGARGRVLVWLAITVVLGLGFVAMEIQEFAGMIAKGAGPDRSGFLSAFFTLVGTHGLHVSVGLISILVMMGQLATKGLTPAVSSRLFRLGLFWHFLDIVWIGIFSIVYLPGVL